MSRMIPPFYDDNMTSDGEKKLFHILEKLSAVSAVLCVMWPRVLLYLFRGRVAYLTLAT